MESKVNNFLEWCEQKGIRSSKIELRYCGPEEGMGIYSKESLRPNEAIIEIPKEQMITSTNIIQIPEYFQLLSSLSSKVLLKPFEVIVLFFYIEESKGEKSSWFPYISMLPESFTTPLALKMDVSIFPFHLQQIYEKQINEVNALSSKLKQHFIHDLDENKFLWAFHVVNTRCIFYDNPNKSELVDVSQEPDSISVIPLMDFMNHDTTGTCLPGFDKYSQQYRITVGDRMIMEERQCFLCYGPHDNGKLWLEYGFQLPKNVFNHVPLTLDLILAILPKIGCTPNEMNKKVAKEAAFSCTLFSSEETISYGLRKTCILLLLSPAELNQWQKIIYDEDYLEEENQILQKSNELALKILKEVAARIQSKISKSDKNIISLYSDQLEILNVILSNSE